MKVNTILIYDCNKLSGLSHIASIITTMMVFKAKTLFPNIYCRVSSFFFKNTFDLCLIPWYLDRAPEEMPLELIDFSV